MALVPEPTETTTKRGRPNAAEVERRNIRAVTKVDAWASTASPTSSLPAGTPSAEAAYAQAKSSLAQTYPAETIKDAERSTLRKMKELEEAYQSGGFALLGAGNGGQASEGVLTVERVIEREGGLLKLAEAVNE